MADSPEMQDIRGLDIDKLVKGFADRDYTFKDDCLVTTTKGDAIRWYQKTAAHLTADDPQQVANVGALSIPTFLEPSWTRNTSYVKNYKADGFVSEEDVIQADVDVLATYVRDLTFAVVKQVDSRIYTVATATTCQTFATTAMGGDQWDAASAAGNPIKDLLHARKLIEDYDYDTSNLVMWIDPIGS